MNGFIDSLFNPIFVREMRGSLRGKRAFTALTIFVLLSAGIFFVVFLSFRFNFESIDSSTVDLGRIGRKVFEIVAILLGVLVLYFTPGFSAGVIAMEREKKTLEFLELTLLTPSEIVRGKLLASLLYVNLLLVTTLPILSLVFILGGVSPREIALLYAALFSEALLVASIGVYQSAANERAGAATVQSYVLTTFLLFFLAGPISTSWSSTALSRATFNWFGLQVHTLWALAVFVGLAVAILLEMAAAHLRNAEYEESFGERLTVGLGFLAVLVCIGGFHTTTGSFVTKGFGVLVVVQLMMHLVCGIAIVTSGLTMKERKLDAPGVLRTMFSPARAFSNRLLSFPGHALLLAAAAAALQAGCYAIDKGARPAFWQEWAIFNSISIVFALGFSLLLTACTYVLCRFLPDLPRILKLLFFAIVLLGIFTPEMAHHASFTKSAAPEGLPPPAVLMIYMCPMKAFRSVEVPGARTQAIHDFPGYAWDQIAKFPGKELPGWIGFLIGWAAVALAGLALILWMRRFDRGEGDGER